MSERNCYVKEFVQSNNAASQFLLCLDFCYSYRRLNTSLCTLLSRNTSQLFCLFPSIVFGYGAILSRLWRDLFGFQFLSTFVRFLITFCVTKAPNRKANLSENNVALKWRIVDDAVLRLDLLSSRLVKLTEKYFWITIVSVRLHKRRSTWSNKLWIFFLRAVLVFSKVMLSKSCALKKDSPQNQ